MFERKVLLLCSVMSAVPDPSNYFLETLDHLRYRSVL